jgi:hypoxanthine phosphoribosyltransferase
MVEAPIEPLIPAETIAARVGEISAALESGFAGRRPLFVVVLLGAFVFASDLLRHWPAPAEVAAVVMSSYPRGTQRAPRTRLLADLSIDPAGRDVVILEDIVDSGRTLQALCERLQKRGPASITVASLLDKPSARRVEVPLHHVGFQVPDAFVVGYGLDWNGLYRNLPYVGVMPDGPAGAG